jgi:hypothetical protein
MLAIILTSYFATAFNSGFESNSIHDNAFARVFINAFSLTPFITQEDRWCFIATTLYILYYWIKMIVRSNPTHA